MKNILVFTRISKVSEYLNQFFYSWTSSDITLSVTDTFEDFSVECKERRWDLFVIELFNYDRDDEKKLEYIYDLMEITSTDCLLLMDKNIDSKILTKIEKNGIYTIKNPIRENILLVTIKNINTAQIRQTRLREKHSQISKKLEDNKHINRAKILLITHLLMTEAEAHKYIEKTSMKKRVDRGTLARQIIMTYDE